MSDLQYEQVTTAVKNIGHWIPATSNALADAGQMRTLIDGFLLYGLEQRADYQIVNGNGAGQNLTGIAHTTGVQAQAYDTNVFTTLRKARTKVRIIGRETPTAYLLSPLDWESIDLATDNDARYFYGGPSVLGTPRLWGLPVAESESVPDGTAYVGNFRQVVFWDRQQGTIQTSNSHADFFIKRLIAILADMRGALGILKPQALVAADLTP
jgi:HK97 family phage major capsid protein